MCHEIAHGGNGDIQHEILVDEELGDDEQVDDTCEHGSSRHRA